MERVFISSVIDGYGDFREAAAASVRFIGSRRGFDLVPWRVEADAPATYEDPQKACLEDVADSLVYILLMGARYGYEDQESHLSATHEEFLEAKRLRKVILPFVQTGVEREAKQQAFLDDVAAYLSGEFYDTYANPDQLQTKIERALHENMEVERGAVHFEGAERLRDVQCVTSPVVFQFAPVGTLRNGSVSLDRGLETLLVESPLVRNLLRSNVPYFDGLSTDTSWHANWISVQSTLGRNPNPLNILRVYEDGRVVWFCTYVGVPGGNAYQVAGHAFQLGLWAFVQAVCEVRTRYHLSGSGGVKVRFPVPSMLIDTPSVPINGRLSSDTELEREALFPSWVWDLRPQRVLLDFVPWLYRAHGYPLDVPWATEIQRLVTTG